MKYASPPGVFDIVPSDPKEPWRSSYLWNYIEAVIREIAQTYGYQEIRTPLFEQTALFQRSSGETSDVVSKEMYTFEDRGGRSISLRPEGTAPVMRALIEGQLYNQGPVQKLFYIAPMFRYDRPQAGRYRQHHQFGAEAIGNSSPEQDVELIDMLYTLYQRLGLKNLTLYINSLGDAASRQAFRDALQDYLRPHLDHLSADSQTRFEANPLRILDSKDPRDQEIANGAPSILDFLNNQCRIHFERVKFLLESLKILYQVNNRLVRGLDYYNKTVFEIVAGDLGAQNSIGGGGRFDGLVKLLGGPDLPSMGFGTGLERIIQTMLKQEVPLPKPNRPMLYLISLGGSAEDKCFSLLHQMRQEGLSCQMDFSGKKLGKMMQHADQSTARFVVVLGDNELQLGEVELKDMDSGTSKKVSLSRLIETLKYSVAERKDV
jgi:histidyl-tRNA synthetase